MDEPSAVAEALEAADPLSAYYHRCFTVAREWAESGGAQLDTERSIDERTYAMYDIAQYNELMLSLMLASGCPQQPAAAVRAQDVYHSSLLCYGGLSV